MDALPVQHSDAKATGPRYQPMVLVAVAVAAGIVLDRYAAWQVAWWWATTAVAWGVWWALFHRGWDRAAAVAVFVAAAALGGAWHHCRWNLFDRDDLGFYARGGDEPTCVEAVALGGPRRQPAPPHHPMRIVPAGDHSRLEVKIVGIRNRGDWQPAHGRARISVDGHLLGIHAGDEIRIFAQLSAIQGPDNPGMFDFAAHARADRLQSQLWVKYPDCISLVASGSVLSPQRMIDAVRRSGDELLWRYLDPDRARLASAVLLGCREEVTTEQTAAFVETGTVHILSISGMHVGILAAMVFFLARWFPISRGATAATVAGVVIFYTLLADAEPPAVRAAVLVVIMCFGHWQKCKALAFNSLAFAALAVMLLNPADLFRTGVQLSFLCMIGLIACDLVPRPGNSMLPALRRLIEQSRPWPVRIVRSIGRWAWEVTWIGMVIWSLTLPLVMARFHVLSPVAVVLNAVLWLPMTAALWTGLGTLMSGLVCPMAAPSLGWCCDSAIAAMDGTVELARRAPGSCFWVPGPADWWLAGFYGALGLVLALPRFRPPRRWCVALLAGWAAVGFLIPALDRDKPHLACTFLSVGHGCAVVLDLPSGKTMLYDAGAFGSPDRASHAISSYLWSRGIRHLDAILLSHADADHYNGVPGVLECFSVGVVYVSPVMFDNPTRAVTALQESLAKAAVPVREVFSGDLLDGGSGCRLEILHPPRRGVVGGDNSNSIVLSVEYQGRKILLPGDLQPPGLNDVLAEEPRHFDVLMAPHHGSRRIDHDAIARWCRPSLMVVSGAHDRQTNKGGVPVTLGGVRVLHTGALGAVEVHIDDHGLQACTLRNRNSDGAGNSVTTF